MKTKLLHVQLIRSPEGALVGLLAARAAELVRGEELLLARESRAVASASRRRTTSVEFRALASKSKMRKEIRAGKYSHTTTERTREMKIRLLVDLLEQKYVSASGPQMQIGPPPRGRRKMAATDLIHFPSKVLLIFRTYVHRADFSSFGSLLAFG